MITLEVNDGGLAFIKHGCPYCSEKVRWEYSVFNYEIIVYHGNIRKAFPGSVEIVSDNKNYILDWLMEIHGLPGEQDGKG